MSEAVRELRAMGSECTLRVVGSDAERLIDGLVERLADLESRWSRFQPSSELSRLNAAGGRPVVMGPESIGVVSLAVEAWRSTDGLFDPTLLDALCDAGYDVDFDRLGDRVVPSTVASSSSSSVSFVDAIVIDREASTVTVPPSVAIDLGGIGKGRAADLLVGEVLGAGAVGACVDLGGDVRVGGRSIGDDGWGIVVDDPMTPGRDLAVLALAEGGVATSSRLRRRWRTSDGEAHHLLDPATGRPAATDLVAVTVVAAETAWAEAHAKAALIGGSIDGMALLATSGLSGIVVTEAGDVLRCGAIDDYLVDGLVELVDRTIA